MRKPSIKTVGVVAVTGIVAFTIAVFRDGSRAHAQPQAAPPPPELPVAELVVRSIEDTAELRGQLAATHVVELRPRVSGFVQEVTYEEGGIVRPGEVFFQFDGRQLSAERQRLAADLEQVRAELAHAELEVARTAKLVETGAVSSHELDARLANRRSFAPALPPRAQCWRTRSSTCRSRTSPRRSRDASAERWSRRGTSSPRARRPRRSRPFRPSIRSTWSSTSHFFVGRPIFAVVLSVLFLVAGDIAFFRLSLSEYPAVTPPTVKVRAAYPGASPDVIAATVASPLEQEVNGVDGMLKMSSQSTTDGAMSLTVTFAQGTDAYRRT